MGRNDKRMGIQTKVKRGGVSIFNEGWVRVCGKWERDINKERGRAECRRKVGAGGR